MRTSAQNRLVARPLPCVGLLLVAVLLASPLRADGGRDAATAARWLQQMERAFRELNYDGTVTFFAGSDLATLRVVHMVIDGRQRERLVHLDGAPREILRDGEDVSSIVMPGDDLLAIESAMLTGPFARGFVRRFDQLSDNYGLSLAGRGRVANRAALRMSVMPKDDNRFGYRLWLDEETKLLLRSELVNQQGQRLEVFKINQLLVGDAVSEASLRPTTAAGQGMVRHLTLADRTSKQPLAEDLRFGLRWIPRGFTMATAAVRRQPRSLKEVATMMYSDGLATFSVFIEDLPDSGAVGLVSRNGATVAVMHRTKLRPAGTAQSGAPEHLVTVVGELPTGTAMKIAESVSHGPATEQ